MNIIDYLKWRGDLSFKQDPFNEVDNLLLSYISYTNFDAFLKGKSLSLKECADLYFKDHTIKEIKKSKSFIAYAPYALLEMSKTNRFKNAILHNYVNIIDTDDITQFSAVSIDIDDNTTYIAYRGTDDTLIGWMEDFDLAYKIVPAQEKALEYLIDNVKPLKKYRVGGHSKGGSLATYAVYKAPDKILNRIINIYNNDGPGINDEIYDEDKFKRIKDIYIDIFPEFSVFGQIYYHEGNTIVIDSNEVLLLEHDSMSWQVEGNKFVQAKQSYTSLSIREELQNFFEVTSSEQREKLVKAFNQAIKKTGAKYVSDLSDNGPKSLIQILKMIIEEDKETKQIASKLFKVVSTALEKTIKNKELDIKGDIEKILKNHIL